MWIEMILAMILGAILSASCPVRGMWIEIAFNQASKR